MTVLTSRDKVILKAIDSGGEDPRGIAEGLDLPVESVISTAETLAGEGLIKIEKSVDEVHTLTEEGRRYALEGLPERKILDVIGAGAPISDLKDPSSKIGLGWLKRKGWASIEAGLIKPIGQAGLGKDEVALKALLEGPKPAPVMDAGAIAALKSRGLVSSTASKAWRYAITPEGRKAASSEVETAQALAQITPEMIKQGEWDGKNVRYGGKTYSVRPYDVSLPADMVYPGKEHPYQRLLQQMREIMLQMGFVEIKGQIIQSSFWNFDALFQPQDHPAREMQDTFYLDTSAEIPDFTKVKEMHETGGCVGSKGWGGCWRPEIARQEVLRTHTTSVSIKYLADHPEPPVKAFSIDRVYRREAIDPTHTPEFEQLEGIIMDKGVTFANLLAVLREFYAKMGFEEVRFRPGYFPYTEPSVEPEVFVDGLGWVELGGAGVFRKEVTAPFGIDHPVLAWGLGVGRVAMMRLGLKDLRELYQSDIQWLRETPLCI